MFLCYTFLKGTEWQIYVYHIGKIRFIVTPVYKETGELMRDILLKLMLADLEAVLNFMRRRDTHF